MTYETVEINDIKFLETLAFTNIYLSRNIAYE